jgi:hypothetical protein
MVAWRVLREPTVPILLAASVVHVVRRELFDLVLFSGTAVLILVDSQRRDAAPAGVARIARPRAWLVVAGMTLVSAVVALAAPASLGARLVLIAIGLAALALVLVRPQRLPGAWQQPSAAAGWPLWAVIGVATCLWELTSFIAQQVWTSDQDAHPAVSDLVGPLLQTWLGRAGFLRLWTAAGWWLLQQLVGSGRADAGRASEPVGFEQEAARSDTDGEFGERSEPGWRHAGSPPIAGRPDGREAGR